MAWRSRNAFWLTWPEVHIVKANDVALYTLMISYIMVISIEQEGVITCEWYTFLQVEIFDLKTSRFVYKYCYIIFTYVHIISALSNKRSDCVINLIRYQITVEIVYNDIGYNDEPDITTEWWPKVWPAMTIHAKKIGYNDASVTTKPLITTQFWSFFYRL